MEATRKIEAVSFVCQFLKTINSSKPTLPSFMIVYRSEQCHVAFFRKHKDADLSDEALCSRDVNSESRVSWVFHL